MRGGAIAIALGLGLLVAATPAWALNKQAERDSDASSGLPARGVYQNLSGGLFLGAFYFNPTYGARPDNTGRALMRFGLHLDVDLVGRWLTLSYDLNSFTDGSSASTTGWYAPSEHDHIVGLLTTIPLPRGLALTLALHYEIDAPGFGPNAGFVARTPGYAPGYTQSYVDAYARLGWSRGPVALFAALGGFLYNPSYAARPDNAGIALLRYVLHGEYAPVSWLALRIDLNFFTDREEFALTPTELDATCEVALRWRDFELRFVGEADLPLGTYPLGGPHPSTTPGLHQMYLATMLSWSFDLRELLARRRKRR